MISFAFLVSLYISASYVAGVYATDVSVNEYRRGRDDPRIIIQRMSRISAILVVNLFILPVILCKLGSATSYMEAFLQLGIWPHHEYGSWMFECIKALALIGLLYLAPLMDLLLYYTFVTRSNFFQDLKEELGNIWGFRNYVFAPITEEIFYTSMILNCYMFLLRERESQLKIISLTPLFFGLAHLHHAYEIHQISRANLSTIILTTLLQVTYTTFFGCLTNCVFLKTGGNLWACILLHAFCNYMGLPEASKLYIYYTDVRKPPSPTAAKLIAWWNKFYFFLLIIGLWLFILNFNPLLVSPNSLI